MDFSYYYRNNEQKSLHEDLSAIIAGFKEIIDQNLSVKCKLINYYKGLPLSYAATPVELHQGTLELDVNQQQAAALESSKYAFLKCDHFNSAILAEVQRVNVPKMMASVRNFSYVEILAERRTALRLELLPRSDAEIVIGTETITGKLRDVSLGGFSIIPATPCNLEPGMAVTLKLVLPNLLQGRDDRFQTHAYHVETITREEYDVCRFSFQADQQIENLISRFIFQRQVEIIKELKERS